MKEFLQQNRKGITIGAAFAVLLYGFKIFFYSISIDTEMLIVEPAALLTSWYQIDRFGLCLFKEFFGLIPIPVRLTNVLTVMFFTAAAVTWLYCFWRIKRSASPGTNLIFLLVLISSPLLAEQFSFTLQSLEMSLAFLLEAIGMIFLNHWIEKKASIMRAGGSVLLFAFCFSCYQSFVFLYVLTCIICYLIRNENKNETKAEWIEIGKYILILLCSFLLYKALLFFINQKLGIISDGSYLGDQFFWGKEARRRTVFRIGKYGVMTLLGIGSSCHPFLAVFDAAFFFMEWRNFRQGLHRNYLRILAVAAMLLIPFVLTILTGAPVVVRAQFCVPFILAFLSWYFVDNIRKFKRQRWITISVALVIFIQAAVVVTLQASVSDCYKREVAFAHEIDEKLQEHQIDQETVVFVGKKSLSRLPKGEIMGRSFFEWDAETPQGSNFRIHNFMKTLGMNYVTPTVEDVERARILSADWPTWDEDPQIHMAEDLVIIKLSDEEER